MAINDTKTFNGQVYTGMAVGQSHLWDYLNAVWEETKVRPDLWKIKFTSIKHRHVPAPEGSGVPLGTQYHWYVMADQLVKKTTADEYTTELNGFKFKLGHKRPYWKGFSYTYKDQPTYRQQLITVLRETLTKLELEEEEALKLIK
jgi:hypothetical protein